MLTISRETTILLNDEYLNYQDTISSIQKRLQNDIPMLGLEPNDLKDAMEYSKDRVTLFRFLKDSDFVEDETVRRLVDTVQWRAENKIGSMTYQSIASEFYNEGFAFFHKQDLLGRPVAIINMRHFPKFQDKTKPLSYFMQPFACLVMEMARQITRDLTRRNEREKVQDKPVLISQISIIIDIAKAPFVPVDSVLMHALKDITNARYPGFVGSVYIMNFGWMYQGIWQVAKLVLSEQAKARVCFPSNEEIKQVINENDLLKTLGGKDEYAWSLDSDLMLDLYATENRFKIIDASSLPSPRISRSSSISSLSSMESGIFFDAPEYLSRRPSSHFDIIRSTFTSSSPSLYGTPGTLTPISAYNNRQHQQQIAIRSPSEPRYFLNGFHMGDTFLTSFFRVGNNNDGQQLPPSTIDGNDLTNRLNQLLIDEGISQDDILGDGVYLMKQPASIAHFPHMLPDSHPQSVYVTSPLRHQLARAEQRMLRYTRKLFHLSFAYNGAVYWVLLYCFLRGPVEHSLKKAIVKLMAGTTQQQITYTTVGLTATVAAALSATFSNSLEKNNIHYYDNNNLTNKRRP